MIINIRRLLFSLIAIIYFIDSNAWACSAPEPNHAVCFKVLANNPEGFSIYCMNLPVTGTRFGSSVGLQGRNNVLYQYAVITAGPVLPVNNGGIQYTQTQNENYWAWVFDGYQGGHAVDWSQNCYGYALGCGDWPMEPDKLIGNGPQACWAASDSDATIAYGSGYAIKITMQDCKNSLGAITKNYSEKVRESGIYTQKGECALIVQPNGIVNTYKGNGPRANKTFTLYKKK